jgi:hypothetical protein
MTKLAGLRASPRAADGSGRSHQRSASQCPRPGCRARRSKAARKRTRAAPRTRPTWCTPRAPPAIPRACCTPTGHGRARAGGAVLVRLYAGGDRILHSGKFNWTYVLGSGLMDPLYRGKTVIVHEGRTTPPAGSRLMAKHQATIFIGVPTIYRQIIQKTESGAADVPSLRHCMSAGEHLSDEMLACGRTASASRSTRPWACRVPTTCRKTNGARSAPAGRLPAAGPRRAPARPGNARGSPRRRGRHDLHPE